MNHLASQRFGRLFVHRRGPNRKSRTTWHCWCDCGSKVLVTTGSLLKGTVSCGCLWRESITRHGLHKSNEYRIWSGMVGRSTNPNHSDYGGRGITVCKRWLKFENFYADMGPRPHKKSLDRRDNEGPYSPENCRWATRKQQNRNTRHVHNVTIKGETLCLTAWVERLGIKYGTVCARIRSGWGPKRALLQSVRKR